MIGQWIIVDNTMMDKKALDKKTELRFLTSRLLGSYEKEFD